MKRRTLLLSGFASLIFFAVIAFIIIGIKTRSSQVSFESNPNAQVYVDGELVGVTPLTIETKKLNIKIKLVALKSESYLPYETTLSLTPQTKVIVRRNLGSQLNNGSGQILQFLETHKSSSVVTVATNPVNSFVFVDSNYVGLSPVSLSPPQGIKVVKIVKEGYVEQSFEVQNAVGFNTLVYSDLAQVEEKESTRKTKKTITVRPNIYGFAYVRREPKDNAPDITRVFPGREYDVLGLSEKLDWIHISLNASESGWIKSQHASLSAQIATPP